MFGAKSFQAWLVQVCVDHDEGNWREGGTGHQAKEGQRLAGEVEGVVVLKYPRRGNHKGIHQAEKEAVIQTHCSNYWFSEDHVDRTDKQRR